MKTKEAFTNLGLHETATEAEVKDSYRKLVKLYHPDVNSDEGAREKFEKIQKSYELILLYFEFSKLAPLKKEKLSKEKIEHISKVAQMKKAKKELFQLTLLQDISAFKKSKKFIFSNTIAIISCLLAFFILYDYYSLPVKSYEEIQGFSSESVPSTKNDFRITENIFLVIQDTKISVSPLVAAHLAQEEKLVISRTQFFKQIIDVAKIDAAEGVDFYNFYNDAVVVLSVLLLGGMVMFIYKKQDVTYYFVVKYYNLYILPLVIIYVLFNEARVFRLFGII